MIFGTPRRYRSLGWLLPLLATMGAAATPAPTVAPSPPAAAQRDGSVRLIQIDGAINPASADFIRESIELAQTDGNAALIIELDTPGGLLESAKAIVKDLLGAPIPVIVYVSPSGSGAVSAGVFVTMAAHVAVMAPGTNIGAAHPVGGQGEDIGGDMRKKVENFTASLSKSIARERGRNIEWAEKAVRESVSINEREAVDKKVVDLIATSLDDLLQKVDGRKVRTKSGEVTLALSGARVVRGEMRLKHKVIDVLANPNVAYLLMMAGMLGLYVEFTHPGVFFPGIAGAISLLLGMAALQVLPINYSGLALLILGLALLIAELFLPSFGVLGIGGMISFVLGSLFLFDPGRSDLLLDPKIVYAAAGTFGAFTLVVGLLVMRTQRRRSNLGSEGLIGKTGQVRQRIPGGTQLGKVTLHGEIWNARAAEPIEVDERVVVTRLEGLELEVKRHHA